MGKEVNGVVGGETPPQRTGKLVAVLDAFAHLEVDGWKLVARDRAGALRIRFSRAERTCRLGRLLHAGHAERIGAEPQADGNGRG